MNILVVGSGAREFAIVAKLIQEGQTVFCAPGNAGIGQKTICLPIKATDITGLVEFAQTNRIDLTIVGPEAPLVAGIVDAFRAAGLAICGPTKAAAQAEASKSWFKDLLTRHQIPTAEYAVFDDIVEAYSYIKDRGAKNIVIKADGLMAGKGVILPQTAKQAWAALTNLETQLGKDFKVLIEERLVGVERSAMAITDGHTTYMLPFTQDYKREDEDDAGRNTGGMGSHTLTLLPVEEAAMEAIVQSVMAAMATEGVPFTGFPYVGIMLTNQGPKVLECNCRLGDPETQVIMASIDDDFAQLCLAAAKGRLDQVGSPRKIREAVCVVLASAAYPDSSNQDEVIYGLDQVEKTGSIVLHAGTATKGRHFTTNKAGRILSIVAAAATLQGALEKAMAGAAVVDYPGKKYRRDVGLAYVA